MSDNIGNLAAKAAEAFGSMYAEVTDQIATKAAELGAERVQISQSATQIAMDCLDDGEAAEMLKGSGALKDRIKAEQAEKTEKPQLKEGEKLGKGEEELQKEAKKEASTAEKQIDQIAQQEAGDVATNPESKPEDVAASMINSFKGRPERARQAMDSFLKAAQKQLTDLQGKVERGEASSEELSTLGKVASKIQKAGARFESILTELDTTANRLGYSKKLQQTAEEKNINIDRFANNLKGKDFNTFSTTVEAATDGTLPSILSVIGLLLNAVGAMMKTATGDIGALTDNVQLAKHCRGMTQDHKVFQGSLRSIMLGALRDLLFTEKAAKDNNPPKDSTEKAANDNNLPKDSNELPKVNN